MKDYAAKEFLHPRHRVERLVIMVTLVLVVLVLGYAQKKDDEWKRIDATTLCRPAPGEIAHMSYTDRGYECAIKRGHKVVARFTL